MLGGKYKYFLNFAQDSTSPQDEPLEVSQPNIHILILF